MIQETKPEGSLRVRSQPEFFCFFKRISAGQGCIKRYCLKKGDGKAGETVQQLKAYAALAEDQSLAPVPRSDSS